MISSPILLTMRNVSDKSCTQNQNTYFIFNNDFPKVVPFMRYVGKYCRFGQATDNMMPGIASWIPKTTRTQSGYLILTAFPRQQWFRERASRLRLYVQFLSCWLSN